MFLIDKHINDIFVSIEDEKKKTQTKPFESKSSESTYESVVSSQTHSANMKTMPISVAVDLLSVPVNESEMLNKTKMLIEERAPFDMR